jgi:hypothetical protein
MGCQKTDMQKKAKERSKVNDHSEAGRIKKKAHNDKRNKNENESSKAACIRPDSSTATVDDTAKDPASNSKTESYDSNCDIPPNLRSYLRFLVGSIEHRLVTADEIRRLFIACSHRMRQQGFDKRNILRKTLNIES